MPNWAVQQQSPRYPIQLPLLHRVIAPLAIGAGVGWTRNLSEGGACVELAEVLPPEMPLRLRLQTDRGAIEVEAEVIWTGEPAPAGGVVPHGVAFTQVAPDQLQALQDLLGSKGEVRHAGARLPFALPVTCQRKDQAEPPLKGWTGDISRGGLLLRLPQLLSPGTALELTLHAPNEALTAEGDIVWVEPPERRRPHEPIAHGVRFTALDGSISLSLGLLLAEPL